MNDLNSQVWAVDALSALAHETRLSVFRMLIQAGPEGHVAGAIAERAGVPQSTMSHHLSTLERAGLVQSERESRLIRYRANYVLGPDRQDSLRYISLRVLHVRQNLQRPVPMHR